MKLHAAGKSLYCMKCDKLGRSCVFCRLFEKGALGPGGGDSATKRRVCATDISPCIMCVQYIGGCSVHRGDIMSTSGGYHEYIGGIS